MQEIKCPKCGEIFQVDESGYAEIVRQVRDKEFRQELERRETELTEKKDSELRLVRAEQERVLESRLAEQKEAASKRELEQKDESAERERRLREEAEKRERELREETEKREREQREAAERSRQELTELRAELDRAQQAQELAVIRAMQDREKQLADSRAETDRLRAELELQAQQSKLNENTLIERQRNELRVRDEEIERLKDFKTRQSTKMVGESLEQHCLTQFNSVRMMSFPNAYFEKDNDARTGSKGDFIFRESADGVEFISIMFEMKNEDFFKELDKDRCEKKCEYAVLVSLLESDSELYNGGIVDVSYRYPKMFVIRPQFFIPLISLLRNAALSSLSYRRELSIIRDRECDLTNFEDNINTFKESFARNYRIASDRFKTAIEEIDKTILHLQKTKDALLSSENNLRIANNKADELSIKRLTRNAPTVRAMLEDIKHGEESK